MKRQYIGPAIYIVGALFVLAGAFFKFQHKDGAQLLLAIGLITECAATGYIIWNARTSNN